MVKERIYGLDFSRPMEKEEVGTASIGDAVYYASSAYVPQLHKALRFLSINSDDAILDYGSGKGAVLAQLRKYPFRRVAGVEISQKLIDISKENLRRLKLTNIEMVNADAIRFTDIDDFNYFYFFNPFHGKTFEAVMENISVSMERRKRSICIIYYYPKCHDLVIKTGQFQLKKVFEDGTRRLHIYLNERQAG
jgi:SAM-dependent methyltransferase